MAYGTRWTIETTNPYSGHTVKALIKERDYSGSVTELDPGDEVAIIRYRTTSTWAGTAHWTMAPSECSVTYVDDGTGLLRDVFSGDDEQFQVLVQVGGNDEWTGFVVPESYEFEPYNRSVAILRATDGLSRTFKAAYNNGVVLNLRDDVVSVMAEALSVIGSDLGIATHCNWYPYIGTNDLDTSDDVLVNLKIFQGAFFDDDNNAYSCGYVLSQICAAFQLQLFQTRNRWHFIQRRRAIYQPVSADKIKLYQYDADTTPDSLDPTVNLDPYKEIDGTTNRFVGIRGSGTIPYGRVSLIYAHGNPSNELVGNPSFESTILANGSGADYNWEPNAAASSDASNNASGRTSPKALRMNAEYLGSAASSFPGDIISTRRVDQTTGSQVVGGASVFLNFTAYWSFENNGTFGWGDTYVCMRLQVGSYWLYRDTSDGLYKWSTTPSSFSEYLYWQAQAGPGQWNEISIRTEQLLDGSTDINGELYIELYGVVEDNNGGSQNTTFGRWDEVAVEIIGSDGETFAEAIRTTVTSDGNVNRSEPEIPQLVLGDGPSTQYSNRLTVLDSTGSEQSITADWGFGPRTFASGLSLNQFAANEMYRQFRQSARRLSFAVHSTEVSEPIKPWYTLRIPNPENTSTPDYFWEDLEYRPASPWSVVGGTWAEIRQDASADELCEFNVEADSVAALSLSLEQGLPCASGGDPFNAPFTVLYAAIQNNAVGATHNFVAKIQRDEGNVGSWSYELVNISQATYGDFVNSYTLLVDEADDIMFLRFDDSNIWAFQLDGTPIVRIWTPDGTNDIMGMTLDVVGNRLFIMMRNDTGGTGRTSVLREYSYDGTYVGAAWSNLWGSSSFPSHLAYHDDTVWFMQSQGTSRSLYSINLNTGNETSLGGGHTTTDANQGMAVVDASAGYYFCNYIGENQIRRLDIPSPGSISTIESTAAEDTGIAIDPLAQMIYWSDDQRSITRSTYAGGSDEVVTVFPGTGAGTYIYGLSTGK